MPAGDLDRAITIGRHPPPSLRRAWLLCYRLYDIADEIDLAKVERLGIREMSRLRLSRQRSGYVHLPNPPLSVALGSRTLELNAGAMSAEMSARLFDHGAASVVLKIALPQGCSFAELVPVVAEVQESNLIDAVTRDAIDELRGTIAEAIQGRHLWDQDESYTVVFVEELSEALTADALVERVDIARLVLGETDDVELSQAERDDVLRQRFQYSQNDLTVVDWNAAFVYEPSGSMDIPDVLEIANAHLLELRYYDDQLDQHVMRIYEQMQRSRRRWFSLFLSPYRKLQRNVLLTLIEIGEFVERVENSLKIIGDIYIAKVYEGSLVQLRVPSYEASVNRKLQLLSHSYQLLKDEIDTDRALALETLIVLLIVTEIGLYTLTGH
jgi:hypothetical protein